MFRKIVVGLGLVVVVAFAGVVFYVASRQHLTFDAPYPRVDTAPDSVRLARGRYVVRVLASCGGCHGDPKQADAYVAGQDVPLTGGQSFDIPPGVFYVRNITPDRETGIGDLPDSMVARALRYGVGHDGRALLPFMNMQRLSDEDLGAVVAYLKQQSPVRNRVPPHRYNLLGKVVKATVLAHPVGPATRPLTTSPRGATVENGRYLVESVANCGDCHTRRDPRTGALIGQPFAGTTDFDSTPESSWSPPNITSGGRLASFTEDQFVARIRAGRVIPHSPMPWQGFQQMSDVDLRAVYRYLMTVPKSTQDVGPPMVPKTKG